MTRSKTKPVQKAAEVVMEDNDEDEDENENKKELICYQKGEAFDNESISKAVEETTSKLDARLIDSLKSIIRRQEFTISTLKTSLQSKNEKIEKLEKQNKDLNNYLAEVLLLTLRTRSEIFPEGSKMVRYSDNSDMECDS